MFIFAEKILIMDRKLIETVRTYFATQPILKAWLFGSYARGEQTPYQLVVIGEAANMLTKEFRDTHPMTPWREIIGMRNFIVHGYNVVDKNEVWSVIQNDLPLLRQQIDQYLDEY